MLKNLSPEELDALAPVDRSDAERINAILDKYELDIKNYYADNSDKDKPDIKAIILRLKSLNHKAINVILKHSGHAANRIEFRRALTEILRRNEIHETCANIISSLPFDDNTRKTLALDTAENAANFPTSLILGLMGNDTDIMEKFLLYASFENIPVILRRWPTGKVLGANIIRKLLESEDERILVPVLSTMKLKFPQAASAHKKRLANLEEHSSAAVRAWAKKLT